MLTNIDKIAIGAIVLMGNEPHKKLSPFICQSLVTNELVYDARMFPQWYNVEPPMVQYVGRTWK